jgi:hypothetical protein
LEKVSWTNLSANPAAIHLLKAYPEFISWRQLPINDGALSLIETIDFTRDHIMCTRMCQNPAAIHLIEKFETKSYLFLSQNPEIFEYDYVGMRESRTNLFHELIQVQFHPKHIDRFEGWELDD